MASGEQKPGEQITQINVTPLVDVMLVLLIIFMVTANYITNQSIKVELPKASTGENISSETKNLGFVVDAQSQIYLDGKEIKIEDIPQIISDFKKKNASVQALIGADAKATHGSVVVLIDTLRSNGVTDFAINIDSSK